jgi:hypothetical protein
VLALGTFQSCIVFWGQAAHAARLAVLLVHGDRRKPTLHCSAGASTRDGSVPWWNILSSKQILNCMVPHPLTAKSFHPLMSLEDFQL